jgi:hypothetical protein
MSIATQSTVLNNLVAKYATASLAGDNALSALVKGISDAGIPMTAKACRPCLLVGIAKVYGITLVTKDRGTGETWPEAAEGLAGAKSCLTRALKAIEGGQTHKDEIEVPAEILKAAKALVKLCAEYEGAAKVRAAAIAQALAK